MRGAKKLKGLEVGIGFIITIIIAVMALVLAIQFLQQVFPQVTTLGQDAINTARNTLITKLDDPDFQQVCTVTLPTTDRKGVTISKRTLSDSEASGRPFKPLIGLKNPTTDTKCYKMDVKLDSVSTSLSQPYFAKDGCFNENCPEFVALQKKALEWIRPSISSAISLPSKGSAKDIDLLLNVGEMKEGDYTFVFSVSEADPKESGGKCPSIADETKWIEQQVCDPPGRIISVVA